ncbi:hypothetical protein [Coxiella-like endosymbiont of Rhipicephalus sanguineus]|uniref:hypothetical protein n=1 Tax=Coxiella-like endosymbiont of Rhipicephalus sanguineus TaxID=1955402 RepID=UPI00203A40DE|nr:hypothetical protein [Coxiella-like endosymbiont of Rhipicephalus sanguineus]
MIRASRDTPLISSWVHYLVDYQAIFAALTHDDWEQKILDYPSRVSFNAEMYQAEYISLVSADSHYDLKLLDMSAHVDKVIQDLVTQLYITKIEFKNKARRPWKISSAFRIIIRNFFVNNYSQGRIEDRYQVAHLPCFSFKDFQFELVLCTDLLFQSRQTSPQLVISELCQVSQEVRVFPLLDEKGRKFLLRSGRQLWFFRGTRLRN